MKTKLFLVLYDDFYGNNRIVVEAVDSGEALELAKIDSESTASILGIGSNFICREIVINGKSEVKDV